MPDVIVILGAGVCGGTAAATLREQGYDGRLVLIGEEPLPPYERPPLSKEYLRGEQPLEQGFVRPAEWYEQHGIEARFGEAARLDAASHEALLEDERVPFDAALIATGARNRRLPVPGIDLAGVLDLRRAEDADRIRDAASRGGRAVLVGMGFIGAEVAASLRHLGVDVTVVEPFETPLYRVLGPEIGRALAHLHRDHGVEMLFGDSLERFEGTERVEATVTSSGRRIECAFAVVGVGVEPVTDRVEGVAIGPDGGIEVDPTLQTSVPFVYAAGDVALHDHPTFGRIRVEHFDNALKMGQVAARNLLGAGEVFDDPHWFWSDQYDANLQMAGFARQWDEMVVRGSIQDRSFAAFLLMDGVLLSTVTLNWPRDVRRSMPLIKARARPDPGALEDPAVDLRTLVRREG